MMIPAAIIRALVELVEATLVVSGGITSRPTPLMSSYDSTPALLAHLPPGSR